MDFQVIHVRAVGVNFGADGMPGTMDEVLLEACFLDIGTHRMINFPSSDRLSRAHASDHGFTPTSRAWSENRGRRRERGQSRSLDGKLIMRCVPTSRNAGFEQYFIHRTGHSIGTEVHANGANMDDLEIHDERRILPNSCFSIEPGIYLPEFGVRSEVNMLIRPNAAQVTGRIQSELVII